MSANQYAAEQMGLPDYSDADEPGYHLREIKRGKLGELSKIQEELDEAKDAEEQGVRIMLLVELADMIGAIEGYLEKHFPGMTLDDLKGMSNVTRRAFESGARPSRD